MSTLVSEKKRTLKSSRKHIDPKTGKLKVKNEESDVFIDESGKIYKFFRVSQFFRVRFVYWWRRKKEHKKTQDKNI